MSANRIRVFRMAAVEAAAALAAKKKKKTFEIIILSWNDKVQF